MSKQKIFCNFVLLVLCCMIFIDFWQWSNSCWSSLSRTYINSMFCNAWQCFDWHSFVEYGSNSFHRFIQNCNVASTIIKKCFIFSSCLDNSHLTCMKMRYKWLHFLMTNYMFFFENSYIVILKQIFNSYSTNYSRLKISKNLCDLYTKSFLTILETIMYCCHFYFYSRKVNILFMFCYKKKRICNIPINKNRCKPFEEN